LTNDRRLQDAFFYSLVYDPTAKTLLADKGEIRIGEKYQATASSIEMQPLNEQEEEEDSSKRETIVYHPYHSLTDRDIDQFLIVAR
jgi:metastasis-associated protein MTA